ncbi:MAG: gamma-glutamyl-gamma-aminobutyrate hydrolase family protein [Thaumarchaeota archaeon]|nr:gamma-glutamyl-gamma-aminobutyrate hydrolase family protein [Nitrososphaerota archaeon]
MPSILAVNNYPATERFVRLVKALEDGGAAVEKADWTDVSPGKFSSFDGVALSGSPDMASKPSALVKFAKEIESIRESKAPILGICYGHQLMAVAFGSRVVEDKQHVLEFVRTELLTDDPLFQGLPRQTMLLESRHQVVESLPVGFELIAKSATSSIAGMRHRNLPLYGVQSHPERYTEANPDGLRLVGNFVRSLR